MVTPVVDFALRRPEVDPKRLALMGLSMGGYLAPRAAAFEHRLAALVANPGVVDLMGGHRVPAKQWQQMLANPQETNQALRKSMATDIGFRWLVNNGMYTCAQPTPLKFLEFFGRFALTPELARRIKCPTLVIASHGDHFMPFKAQKKLYDELTCPKTLMVFTRAQHAQAHCQMGAMAVSNMRILDWLDETLSRVR